MAKSDHPSLLMRVTKTGLVPVTAFDAELFATYAEGTDVTVEIRKTRNMRLNGLYWRNLGLVVDATGMWPSTRQLNRALIYRAGHFDEIRQFDGGIVMEGRSLSDFDADEFKQFFDWAMAYICSDVIPGLDLEELLKGNFVMKEAA